MRETLNLSTCADIFFFSFHMSCVRCHMSHVKCRVSPVTCHLSSVTNTNSHSHRPFCSYSPIMHYTQVYKDLHIFQSTKIILMAKTQKKSRGMPILAKCSATRSLQSNRKQGFSNGTHTHSTMRELNILCVLQVNLRKMVQIISFSPNNAVCWALRTSSTGFC